MSDDRRFMAKVLALKRGNTWGIVSDIVLHCSLALTGLLLRDSMQPDKIASRRVDQMKGQAVTWS